jgi:thiamine pyrophosphate-dependent acetolactate synthase large subunit-like protein
MGQVFRRAEQYLDQLDVGSFVEIGSSREGDGHLRVNGDGGSTYTIAKWADTYQQQFITVDMDPDQCELVRRLNIPNVSVVNQLGEEFLSNWPKHTSYISFLYLDNFDWDWHPEKTEQFVIEQQEKYKTRFGIEMNNVNSQRAHLAQMVAALPAMAPKSIVVCDDTWYNKWWGHYSGKSGSVVPLLLNNGYKVLYTEEDPVYGTILGRGLV